MLDCIPVSLHLNYWRLWADTERIGRPPLCHPCYPKFVDERVPVVEAKNLWGHRDQPSWTATDLWLARVAWCWAAGWFAEHRTSRGPLVWSPYHQRQWFTIAKSLVYKLTEWLNPSYWKPHSKSTSCIALMSVTCASFWQPGDSGETYSATSSMASLGWGGDIRYASEIYAKIWEDSLRRCKCWWECFHGPHPSSSP